MKTKVFYVYFLLFISFVLFSCSTGNKTNVIQLNLEANNYKELILKIQIFNNSTFNIPVPVYFSGTKKDDCWTFCYSDTLYDKNVSFTIQENTYIDTLSRYIGFKYICNKDTVGLAYLSFANKDTTIINATYLRTDTLPNSPDTDKNGNTIFKTVLIDYYLLASCQDEELLSSLEVSKTGFYWEWGDVDSSRYKTELEEYNELVKKYPDSHSLIYMLDSKLNIFKSKNDVQKVFDYFSQKNRNSFYGKRVNQYLTDNYFKNSILKSWDTGESEAIIMDSAKFNLIIFASTGCKPCINEIPILKKIYDDLSDKIDMTYVSIDNSKTVEGWRQLMRKENIPWRCVLAEDEVDYIINKYHVWEIPYCIMVHPGGFMELIHVPNIAELNYLYTTVQEGK